jgi:hypothetical protein
MKGRCIHDESEEGPKHAFSRGKGGAKITGGP